MSSYSNSNRRIPSFQCLIPWDNNNNNNNNNKLDAFITADNISDTESDYETCYEEYHGTNSNSNNNRLSASSSFCIDDIGSTAVVMNQDEDYWVGPIVDSKSDDYNKPSMTLRVSSKKRDRAFIAEKLSRMRKSASFTQIKTAAASAIIRPKNNNKNNNNPSRISRISSMPHLNIISPFSSSLKSKTTKSSQIITIQHDKDAYRENNNSLESSSSSDIILKFRIDPISSSTSSHNVVEQQQLQPPFTSIGDDITLVVFSYLNPTELRICSAISSHFKTLGHCHYLWINHCCNKWPLLDRARKKAFKKASTRRFEFRNDCPLPKAFKKASTRQLEFRNDCPLPSLLLTHTKQQLNLHLFHALSQPFPHDIDSQFLSSANNSTHQQFRQYSQPLSTSHNNNNNTMMVSVIQFIRPVGRGDRSIQSNHPFPSFKTISSPKQQRGGFVSSLFGSLLRKSSLFQSGGQAAAAVTAAGSLHGLLSRGRQTLKGVTTTTNSSSTVIRPFVSPLLSLESEDGVIEVDVTPRLVAYYEISLLDHPHDDENGNNDVDDNRPSSLSSPVLRPTDCIAIGLATRDFDTSLKMPGWDNFSYGYHGDDGGIFHSHGNMFRSYGPRFGASDTVGCGIDYVNRGIFFTLNGTFLGYAWTGVDLLATKTKFYPTVGVDSHCPVAFNFGSRPFAFDLRSFVNQHSKVVSDLLLLDNHEYYQAVAAS